MVMGTDDTNQLCATVNSKPEAKMNREGGLLVGCPEQLEDDLNVNLDAGSIGIGGRMKLLRALATIVFVTVCFPQAIVAKRDNRETIKRRADVAKQIQETLHDGSIWVVSGRENTTLLGYYTDMSAQEKMQHPQENSPQMQVLKALHDSSRWEGKWLYGFLCIADEGHINCLRLPRSGEFDLGAADYSPNERESFESAFSAAQRISQGAAVAEADTKAVSERPGH
jgi:hypothetical protein